jgi:hypothetical protein
MRRLALAAALLLSFGVALAQDAAAPATPSPPPARNNATVTPCGACCAPGGSCDNAFKGAPVFPSDAGARARDVRVQPATCLRLRGTAAAGLFSTLVMRRNDAASCCA